MAIDPGWIEEGNTDQLSFFRSYISKKLNKGEVIDFFSRLQREGDYFRTLKKYCGDENLSTEDYKSISKMRTAWQAKLRRQNKRKNGTKVVSFELTEDEFKRLKELSKRSNKSMTLVIREIINSTFREWLEVKRKKEERLNDRHMMKKHQKTYDGFARRMEVIHKPDSELAKQVAEFKLAFEKIKDIANKLSD